MSSFAKTLLSGVVVTCLFGTQSQAVDVPAASKVSGPIGGTGGGLKGEYWRRPVASIPTDGNSNPANRIDVLVNGFGTPTGTFTAKNFVYLGNDLSSVTTWLGSDATSYIGANDNLDDGAFRFSGYVNIAAPGPVNLGTTSDDGSRVKIGGVDIIANDGSHGDVTVDAVANFLEAGLYPVEITFFNGDWTSDGGHNGSLNPADHGGANFHLRIGGADITPAIVSTYLFPEIPSDLPYERNIGQNKIGSVTNNGLGSFTIVGGGNDIWDGRDEFTYKYTEVAGDFDVQVRIDYVEPNARWTKAGLMVRESLSDFSRMAFLRATPLDVPTLNGGNGANDVNLGYRTGLDNSAGPSGGQHEDGSVPYLVAGGGPTNNWVRLTRIGNVFTAFASSNGVDWATLTSQDTATWGGGAVKTNLYVGLGVGRHSGGPTARAEFRGFKFNTNNAPFTLVNASSRGNPTGVRLNFNNPIGAGAFTAGNYTIAASGESNVTVVAGLRFTTGNDAPERDPMTWTLEGTTGDPAIGAWTLIATGLTGFAVDPGRNVTGPIIPVANTTPYVSYRLLFPTVRDSAAANSMQIAEIDFLDAANNQLTAISDYIIGVRAVAGSPVSEVAVVGTAAGVNNYPAAEPPIEAIDDVLAGGGAKYLNFAEINTGVIVTPSVSVAPSPITIIGAAQGPNANTVQLTTSRPMQEGATYTITVAGVSGADGGALANNTASFVHGQGYEALRIRITHNKTGDSGYYRFSDAVARGIGDVVHTGGGVFPPQESNTLFEDPIPDMGNIERFGSRISGVLVAPTTGNYNFASSSDDAGYLYLSTDANPANKVQIAREPEWNGSRQYAVTDRRPNLENRANNIPLVAGRPYYIEYIYNEGGGGNNGSATWQPPGAAAITNGALPIPDTAFVPSRLFQGSVFQNMGPVRIVQQPANQTVVALLPVTFTVGLDGTPAYSYQWRRNGQPIPGATGPSYTIPAAQLTDDQVDFSVVVGNEFSSAISANARLTVLTPTSPHLTGARTDTSFTRIFVSFDNRVSLQSATNPANYTVSGGITVLSAVRDANARGVVLTTTAPMAEDTTYTLTVQNINDETGTTTIDPNPSNVNFTTFAFAPGFITKEYNFNFGGGAVDAYIAATRAGTTQPASVCLTNIYEFNVADQFDNYGGHMFGYFIPPVSGNYTFYIATDDPGRLFLSTDANPANAVEIAREPVWASRREWVGAGGGGGRVGVPSASGGPQANISGAIPLVAGNRYYIESFFTEGGGGDNMGVTVKTPAGTDPLYDVDPVNGGPGIPSRWLGAYVQAGVVQITAQPKSQTNVINGFATFTANASSTSALCGGGTINYTWTSNGVVIPGANGPSLTIGPLTADANGAVFQATLTAPARTVISSNAVLTVIPDLDPPDLVYARTDDSFNTVRVNWNELMAQGPAIEAGNYFIKDPASNRIDVLSIDFAGSNVVLHLAQPLTPGTRYTLEIDFQTDLAGNQTLAFGNPVEDPANGVLVGLRSWAVTAGVAKFDAYLGLSVPNNNDVTPILSSPNYPGNPSFSYYSNVVNRPQSVPDLNNYGLRWTFFFTAPSAGTYKFEPAHDDAVRIYAALDGNPANKVDVFNENCCNGFGAAEAGYTVDLTAGQVVFFEVLVIEAGGGDYAGLAVTLPGGQYVSPITGQYISAYADPTNPSFANFRIARAAGGQVTISWGGAFCLQETSQIGPGAVWTASAVVNGVPFTPAAAGNKFYRLVACP